MSVDKLQNGIRKLKNPSMVMFCLDAKHIPPEYHSAESGVCASYGAYAKAILLALKDVAPAVRFDFGSFAIQGTEGIKTLSQLLDTANEQGYYILLEAPAIHTPRAAELAAETLSEQWRFDGLLLSGYLGSDGIKPFVQLLKSYDFDLFMALRTANKSASELQDLLAGTRLVYTVAADMAKLLGEDYIARCGYSRIGGMGPATSGEKLEMLRSKYPQMFLLIDGFDYSGANAKNCSMAFDKLGHGAVACVGESVLAAWKEETGEPVALAVEAAERMKKNLNRYISIL